ncbi:MAG TPA: hypothetical protein PKM27_09585 [Saprospiraceae bacterium]|nr:hypothetical protein [Saprospiraceae bacterium]HNT21150.1 hypothetical protein [Saprospiraceae bacterium]
MEQDTPTELLNHDSKNHLATAGTWARLLGILGFIFTAFIFLAALMMLLGGSYLNQFLAESSGEEFPGMARGLGTFTGLLYLVIGGIYFLISWWTFRFGNEIREGLMTHSPEHMAAAFNNLKNYFQAYGVLTLVAVGFMLLSVLGVMLVGFF